MPIGTLRRSRKTKKLEADVRLKQEYAKHYKKAGPRHAMTYAQWLKKGREVVYFRGHKKKTVEAQLREAGVTLKRRKR